jgi:hypothetical protein
MGMDQAVTFADTIPSWNAVQELLAGRGYPVQMRMIDGELAFPDEAPPEAWRELRVGTAQGMVTLRRDGQSLVFVTWGNADAPMRQAWNALTWAYAKAGGGQIHTGAAVKSADEFQGHAEMPEVLRGGLSEPEA